MSIIVTSFPITESATIYNNLFKAFVKNNIELQFQDESSCTVTDAAGFIKLSGFTDYSPSAGANVGETIVIVGGDYQPVSGLVTSETLAPDQIITDIPYVANATVRFYFKYSNIRMTYRFAAFTTQDNQSATNLFDT